MTVFIILFILFLIVLSGIIKQEIKYKRSMEKLRQTKAKLDEAIANTKDEMAKAEKLLIETEKTKDE